MMRRPVLIMAGGTGGHVFPALAVAQELSARDVPVVWLGTRRGLEAEVVSATGVPVEWLSIVGLRGKGWPTTCCFHCAWQDDALIVPLSHKLIGP